MNDIRSNFPDKLLECPERIPIPEGLEHKLQWRNTSNGSVVYRMRNNLMSKIRKQLPFHLENRILTAAHLIIIMY
ncbi:MAG: hypothetical protein JXA25_10695 [Anaerolineales bacterium]|nr:hypothetical protein [Anaerolineales bacterium]